MKKKKITVIIVSFLVVAMAVAAGIIFWPKEKSFHERMLGLMKGTQMGNENFIGFSLIEGENGEQKNYIQQNNTENIAISNHNYQVLGDTIQPLNDSGQPAPKGTMLVFDENYKTEELYFKKPGSEDVVLLEQISQWGVITKFGIMDNFLFIQITAKYATDTTEIIESEYFHLGRSELVFVIDLNTKEVYCLNEVFADYNFDGADISLHKYMLGVNINIVTREGAYFSLTVENNKLKATKIANKGVFFDDNIFKDYYGNKYILPYLWDGDKLTVVDIEKIDTTGITILEQDFEKYVYYKSTDDVFYRVLRSSNIDGFGDRYAHVEKLQADKTWARESSSSDKIITGERMIIDGNLVTIAHFFDTPMGQCYKFGDKIYAMVYIGNTDRMIYLADVDEITSDFLAFVINEENYLEYETVVVIENNDENIGRLFIRKTRTGYVLYKNNEKYQIKVGDEGIYFESIKPIYNGYEILSEIIHI